MKKLLFMIVCIATIQSCMVMDPYQGSYGNQWGPSSYYSPQPQIPNYGGNWNPYINGYQNQTMVQQNPFWLGGMGVPQYYGGQMSLLAPLVNSVMLMPYHMQRSRYQSRQSYQYHNRPQYGRRCR